MNSSGISTQMVSLGTLLRSIDDGGLALPDFQRPFEWDIADIEQMLVTALMGWPAGSLLLHSRRDSAFRLRPFEGGPSDVMAAETVVLDGQQRLTALYQALYGKGSHVFAIAVGKYESTSEIEESIRAIPRNVWGSRYNSPLRLRSDKLVPLTALRSPTVFFEWRDHLVEAAGEADLQYRDALTNFYRNYLAPIHSYEFPVVLLGGRVEPEAIARIFERVNRTGMRLGTFDLMVAKTYSEDWNLRERWNDFCLEYPEDARFFESDGMVPLTVAALVAREDVRQAAVLGLEKQTVKRLWGGVLKGMQAARAFLAREVSAHSRNDLPYPNAMAVLLSAIGDLLSRDGDHADAVAMFWAQAFGRAFDVAANTRVSDAYKKLKRAGRVQREMLTADVSEIQLIAAARQGSKALSSALRLLILARGGMSLGDGSSRLGLAEVSVFDEAYTDFEDTESRPSIRVLGFVGCTPGFRLEVKRKGFLNAIAALNVSDEELSKHFLPPMQELRALLVQRQWRELLSLRAAKVMSALREQGVLIDSSASAGALAGSDELGI